LSEGEWAILTKEPDCRGDFVVRDWGMYRKAQRRKGSRAKRFKD